MEYKTPGPDKEIHWISAHVCPECEHPYLLEKLDLGEATTGIISCPKCPWSGQINIQIIKKPTLE